MHSAFKKPPPCKQPSLPPQPAVASRSAALAVHPLVGGRRPLSSLQLGWVPPSLLLVHKSPPPCHGTIVPARLPSSCILKCPSSLVEAEGGTALSQRASYTYLEISPCRPVLSRLRRSLCRGFVTSPTPMVVPPSRVVTVWLPSGIHHFPIVIPPLSCSDRREVVT